MSRDDFIGQKGSNQMSMEIFVLSDRRLGSIAEWQQAIDAEGFDLRLDTSRAFDALRGHLPAHRGEQHSGFECDHWDPGDVFETYTDIDFDRRWKHTLAFRWGADLHACVGAYMAAAAYARATDGVVLDCEEGRIVTPQRASEIAREVEKQIPAIEAAIRKMAERRRQ